VLQDDLCEGGVDEAVAADVGVRLARPYYIAEYLGPGCGLDEDAHAAIGCGATSSIILAVKDDVVDYVYLGPAFDAYADANLGDGVVGVNGVIKNSRG
jgi:hypothetical protein